MSALYRGFQPLIRYMGRHRKQELGLSEAQLRAQDGAPAETPKPQELPPEPADPSAAMKSAPDRDIAEVEMSGPQPYHAYPRGGAPQKPPAAMAENLTEAEIRDLGEAPRGPGTDPIIEQIAVGKYTHTVRWRNSGEHPLTLAYHQGRINGEQFDAGELFRMHFEALHREGRDSTNLDRISGARVGDSFSESKEAAGRWLAGVEKKLSRSNFIICEKFCGMGYTPLEAVQMAKRPFNRFRITSIICEALDALRGKKKVRRRSRRGGR